MGLAGPLEVLLLQCRSIMYLHPVKVLSLWCFYRESLLLRRSLLVCHMLVGFVPSSLCFYIYVYLIVWMLINDHRFHAFLCGMQHKVIFEAEFNRFELRSTLWHNKLALLFLPTYERRPNYQPMVGDRIFLFIPFLRVLALYEIQVDLFGIKTWLYAFPRIINIIAHAPPYIYIYIYIYICMYVYIYIYIYTCVCKCVCVRTRMTIIRWESYSKHKWLKRENIR